EHAPSLRPAPRATGDLSHKLERPFAGPKVGEMEPGVGIDHPYHGHVGKIQALRDHLGAEQDVHVSARDTLQDVVMGPLAGGRVEVHPRDAGPRKPEANEMLELLSPEAA